MGLIRVSALLPCRVARRVSPSMPDSFHFRLEAQLVGEPVRLKRQAEHEQHVLGNLLIDTPQIDRVPRTVLRCIVPSQQKVSRLAPLTGGLEGHGAEPPQGFEKGNIDPQVGIPLKIGQFRQVSVPRVHPIRSGRVVSLQGIGEVSSFR